MEGKGGIAGGVIKSLEGRETSPSRTPNQRGGRRTALASIICLKKKEL